MVHSKVYTFIEDTQCIYSLQFGFRKKHSTNHALVDITETIRQALDDKKLHAAFLSIFKKPLTQLTMTYLFPNLITTVSGGLQMIGSPHI